MADQEVWLLCSFYHEPLRTWIKTNNNKFAISNHMVLELDVQALRSYLSLIWEYELYILPNKKLVPQRIMVKTSWRTDHPCSTIFCVIIVHLDMSDLLLRGYSRICFVYTEKLARHHLDWSLFPTYETQNDKNPAEKAYI